MDEHGTGEDGGQADALAALLGALDSEVASHPEPPRRRTPATATGSPAPPGAEPVREALEEAGTERYIVFSLGRARYAVPIGAVIEVGAVPPVTPVPHLPAWVLGVTNLRGEILSVVDLAGFLGASPEGPAAGGRMLVVRGEAEEPFAGLVVDQVAGLASFAAGRLTSAAAPLDDPVSTYLAGVVERGGEVVAVLDVKRLLAADALGALEAA